MSPGTGPRSRALYHHRLRLNLHFRCRRARDVSHHPAAHPSGSSRRSRWPTLVVRVRPLPLAAVPAIPLRVIRFATPHPLVSSFATPVTPAEAPTRSGQPEPHLATRRTSANPACSQRVCHTEGPETAPRTHHMATDMPITVAARPHPPRPSPTRSASPSPATAPAAPDPSSSSIRVASRATPSPARRASPARPVPSS